MTKARDLADLISSGNIDATEFEYLDGVTSDIQTQLDAKLETETNDLSSAVIWANVPDANITQSSVTQHQAALSVTESQISDLGSYASTGKAIAMATVFGG